MIRWDNIEGLDFYIETRGPTGDGKQWIGLFCSQCGPVQATAEGPPTDLADLALAAQGHCERRHNAATCEKREDQ